MDFYVVLDRQGYRVARRRRAKARVGVQHRVTKEDAIKWCVPLRSRSAAFITSVRSAIRQVLELGAYCIVWSGACYR